MTIIGGIDAHEKELVCRFWRADKTEETKRFGNTPSGRGALWTYLGMLKNEFRANKVVLAYEASGLGFTLRDEAEAMGFQCHVLATIKMPRSVMDGKRKTDEYDAQRICDLLRAHELAGLDLPTVWVPDKALRDDRELIRRRFDIKQSSTRVKNQIHGLLRRNGIKRPVEIVLPWTKKFMKWINGIELPLGAKAHLNSLISEYASFEENVRILDQTVEALSRSERYRHIVAGLTDIKGVGILTAMVFLTELGDLRRFPNRRTVKSYVGLAPSSNESGDVKDRKGRITRTGPSRLRAVLNQAVWARIKHDPIERRWYDTYVATHGGLKKKAACACMSRLVVVMWHRALGAQQMYEKAA
jgi:transposase